MSPVRLAALLLVSLPLAVHAGCKELGAAVDAAQKEIAAQEVQGMLDASRETKQLNATLDTTRQLRISSQMAAVQANLLLMDRAKCPMPADPVGAGDGNPYLQAASQCAAAKDADACRRESWKRSR